MNQILPSSRRAFLGSGLVAAAGVGLASSRADAEPGGNAIPNLYPNWAENEFEAILKHENAHLPAVINYITQNYGAAAVRPKPRFKNLNQPTAIKFATTSHVFERLGTGANFGAGPFIFSKQTLAFLASIGFIEAQHAGWLNSLFNLSHSTDVFGNDQDFQTPLTPAQVATLANPFIQDLNGGPPATYGQTPSRANDLAILNFTLVVEYLENDFYNINVPKFFPG